MRSKPKLIAIDVETTGLSHLKDKLHGLGVAYEEDETAYYPADSIPSDVLDLLRDEKVHKLGQNLRFDLRFLSVAKIQVNGPIWDTKIMASLVDENGPQGLKELADKYLGTWALKDKRELDSAIAKAGLKHVGELCAADLNSPSRPYTEVIGKYCEEDCNNTYKLAIVLSEKLKLINETWKKARHAKQGPWDYFVKEAMPLERVLLEMELRGIRIDGDAIAKAKEVFDYEKYTKVHELTELCAEPIAKIEEELYEEALAKRKSEKGKAKVQRSSDAYSTRFNWASSAHLGNLLFKQIGAPAKLIKTTKSGRQSTNDKDLASLRHLCDPESLLVKVLNKLSELKKVEKLLTTYVGEENGLVSRIVEGRIYPHYLQVGSSKEGGKGGTVTGRLSSQNPNIQNIPRSSGIKRFFVPDEGKVFVYADYSQLELRLAAHLSKDPNLVRGYTENLDLHSLTASNIFGCKLQDVKKEQRQVGKTINFAMIYDAGAYRLAEELNKGGANYDVEKVEEMRRAFFETYEVYKMYLKEQKHVLIQQEALISELGRVRRIPEIRYGKYLDWSTKTLYKGLPLALRLRLLQHPNELVSEQELFFRARKKFNHALKQGYNFPIQSLGASIAKRAMLALAAAGANLVTQVHDSIIVEVDADKAEVAAKKMQELMQTCYKLSVPLVAETKIIRSFDETDLVQPKLKLIEGEKKNASQVKQERNFKTHKVT